MTSLDPIISEVTQKSTSIYTFLKSAHHKLSDGVRFITIPGAENFRPLPMGQLALFFWYIFETIFEFYQNHKGVPYVFTEFFQTGGVIAPPPLSWLRHWLKGSVTFIAYSRKIEKKFFRFSSKNRLFRVISRRKIDCAHFRSMKN